MPRWMLPDTLFAADPAALVRELKAAGRKLLRPGVRMVTGMMSMGRT